MEAAGSSDVGTVRLHIPENSRFKGISSRSEQLSDFKEDHSVCERVDFP
jgi:hypothetical protein